MKKNVLILLLLFCHITFAQIIPTLPTKPKETKPTPVKVEKELKTVYKEKETSKAVIKFLCDADAVLYIDGEKKGMLKKDIALRVGIAKGEYVVKVVSAENQNDFVKFNYEISEIGVEKLQRISLQDVINQRLANENAEKERQRIVAEAEVKAKLEKQREMVLNDIYNIEMINVGSFSIGKYEVTQGQWQIVMGNNPSEHKDCPTCPVENVSFNEVQEFIQKLNTLTRKSYRLPKEAEWEYAAKGGKLTHNYEYAGGNDINSVAWYFGNSNHQTQPVGQKQPNELGIFDMTGNVSEWCNDRHPNRHKYRVLRGGTWRYDAAFCRVAYRDGNTPASRSARVGFRLVSP